MPDIMQRIGHEVLVCDGALGTMLQRAGMPPGACPEQLNVLEPETIADIHRLYMLAGSQCAITNSFGGTRAKLAEWGLEGQVESLNRAAVRVAREAGVVHILADVGPTGLVMEPLGSATFEEVYELFAEQIKALAAEGPDAILFETFTDIAEIRCAVLAAKAVCDVPLFASATFGHIGRMDLSGTDPETAAVILSAAGADVVGMNCGLGPEQMLPLVDQMAKATALPLIVQPNAGMPRLVDGVTVFPGTPDEMGSAARRFVELGAAIVGSCCGSTPEFTGSIADYMDRMEPLRDRPSPPGVAIAGPRRTLRLGPGRPLAVIGERINPTGKPKLAESLRSGSTSIVRDFAAEQARAGADALDVNVGAAGVDATVVLPRVVTALSGMSDLPLVIDTTDREALEAALRVYPGRALVNSVNGGEDSLETVLPLAARYGAAVVALALDDGGIPETAAGREAVVERIRTRAHSVGLGDDSLVVDALVMTAATDADAPRVTLDAMSAAAESGLATLLGVSNVSHGLPDRALLNAAFLDAAAARGLDAAIVNPNDSVVMEAVRLANQARASGVPSDAHEASWAAWESALQTSLRDASDRPAGRASNPSSAESGTIASADDTSTSLRTAVIRGDAEVAPPLVDSLVAEGVRPDAVISEVLTPAIQTLGDAYGRGEVFLPQLMVAADAMKAAVARAKTYMPESADTSRGRVVFATVKGDIHSIGKDICISLLESQGFDVKDLGVDVDADTIVEAAAGADVVCLSALMTTTLRVMESSVRRLAEERASVPVLVGGAVVTRDWADSVGAGYSDDAPGCVREVERALAASEDAIGTAGC
jgi:5-methyltetrahydrofolate--homocysteine methyltransferase